MPNRLCVPLQTLVSPVSALGSKQINRVRWYAYRLAAMSPAEVYHRAAEQAKRLLFRMHTPGFGGIEGSLPVLPGIRERLLSLSDEAIPVLSWAALYRAAEQRNYSAFGHEWPPNLDNYKRWHVDPISGKSWPTDVYCFSIRYRDEKDIGDVKYVWEFNRLQHLQPIAAYAARSGDAEAVAFCQSEIESWIAANPPYLGINWSSGIELALRAVSLIVIVSLLGPETFTGDQRRNLLSCLAAHGYWLNQFPSRFSSANNHLVAEAGALFLLGTLAPDLPGAESWKRYGRQTLEKELAKQIFPDGVGAEQSPTYTAFSLEWWILASVVADSVEAPFSAAYSERLRAAGTFLRWILDDQDHHPRIGDDDEGRVIFSPQENDAYVPSVLQAAAAATATGEVAPNAAYPHLWRALHSALPDRVAAPRGFRTFADGGYSVVREQSSQGELLLLFDHGPLGYLSIAAHGHADALAIWLHLGGQPVIVDAGTFLYHSGKEWRDHFRGTAAHNTLLVENQDSSRIVGPFNWSQKAGARLLDTSQNEHGWRLEADHDGFQPSFGVRHHRTIVKTDTNTFDVTDTLVGSAEARQVEAGFLINPELSVSETDENNFLIADGPRPLLTVSSMGPLKGAVESGQLSPRRGWYSSCFGLRQATSRIVFQGKMGPEQPNRLVFSIVSQ